MYVSVRILGYEIAINKLIIEARKCLYFYMNHIFTTCMVAAKEKKSLISEENYYYNLKHSGHIKQFD
jgi:hypothetical protein